MRKNKFRLFRILFVVGTLYFVYVYFLSGDKPAPPNNQNDFTDTSRSSQNKAFEPEHQEKRLAHKILPEPNIELDAEIEVCNDMWSSGVQLF